LSPKWCTAGTFYFLMQRWWRSWCTLTLLHQRD
jgi:hypothetical protein